MAKPTSTSAEPLQSGVRATAVAEANRFLATFDLDSIDEARAIQEFQRQEGDCDRVPPVGRAGATNRG